jgi:hypothetical protein
MSVRKSQDEQLRLNCDAKKAALPVRAGRGFDVRDHILPVVLTDAKEDGGLFGFRF